MPTQSLVCSGLCPTPLVLVLGATDGVWFCSLALPSGVSGRGDAPEPPVLQAGRSQLSQPFLVGEVLHPHHKEFSTTRQKKQQNTSSNF